MIRKHIITKAMERGALMLEALAVLGLIAVVTPTMYKKSAERTLEVEDINTADTVRTYTKAVELYMSENMSTIMANFEAGGANISGNVMTVNAADLAAYLPYKFDVTRNLYDYLTPKIRIYKNGSNLTSFILFPAKGNQNNGIGQERTSRIAALVGSNGGYVTGNHTARGVGGVWSLDSSAYETIFGNDDSSNVYSLISSSSSSTYGSANGNLESSKYLQRTYDTDQEWRNTMRTDLYMGGYTTGDDYPVDHPAGNHSIRNINSLIVGSQYAGGGTEADVGNYGLYISGDKSNSFIAGTLEAGAKQFFTSADMLGYGKISEEDDDYSYNFMVYSDGDMTNTGSIALATDFNNDALSDISVTIGGKEGDEFTVLKAQKDTDNNSLKMSLLNEDIVEIDSLGYDSIDALSDANVKLMKNGYNKISSRRYALNNQTGVIEAVVDTVSSGSIDSEYISANKFQVKVGSNMMVDGTMAAGGVDAGRIRAKNISVGADHADDAAKWLEVDSGGMTVMAQRVSNPRENTEIKANKSSIRLQKGKNGKASTTIDLMLGESGGMTGMGSFMELTSAGIGNESKGKLMAGGENVEVLANNNLDLRSKYMRTQMLSDNKELLIGVGSITDKDYADSLRPKDGNGNVVLPGVPNSHSHRTVFEGGHVDLLGSNLRVMDSNGYNVLSVVGNSQNSEASANGRTTYRDHTTVEIATGYGDKRATNLAIHGGVVFTNRQERKAYEAYTSGYATSQDDGSVHFLTMGPADPGAAVNIIQGNPDKAYNNEKSSNNEQVLVVDLDYEHREGHIGYNHGNRAQTVFSANDTFSDSSSGYYTVDPGTIYIRKGLLEIAPDKDAVSSAAYRSNDGQGVIRASRFVANNVGYDDSGSGFEEVKVPQLIKDEYYTAFNGANSTRYDAYMVNPAYTSVMNDIKLVSRGGARLSDIMPDFITKGVYVVKNDYDDATFGSTFGLSFTLTYGGGDSDLDVSEARKTSIPWASPYSGVVPMPQCPPGYARVITLAPSAFQMGQAGTPAYTGWQSHSALYVPDGGTSNIRKLTELADPNNEIKDYVPEYAQPKIDISSNGEHSITLKSGDDAYSKTYSVERIKNLDIDSQYIDEENHAVVLSNALMSRRADALLPLTFQQNTFLKSHTVALKEGASYSLTPEDADAAHTGGCVGSLDNYCQAWAILLGYIYPKDVYEDFAKAYGLDGSHDYLNASSNSYYWNIFPVLKTSINAYATTYCYFDRENSLGNFRDADTNSGFDPYTYIYKTSLDPTSENFDLPEGYTKLHQDSNYWKHLNDPSMKYDEQW